MQREIKQQGSEIEQNNTEEEKGGYMRSLHKLEEKLYSPELNLNGIAMKVLLFIRHETIRWDAEQGTITYSDIALKTGINERRAKEAIKVLEKKKLIIVMRRKIGTKTLPNIIGLNSEYFGELVEPTCRPKLSVVQGGKVSKLSTGVPKRAPLFTQNRTSLYVKPHPEGTQEPLLERLPGSLKNPFKEPSKTTTGEIVESKGISWEKAKAKLLESYPADDRKLRVAFNQISCDQSFKGVIVEHPPGFILKGWPHWRHEFAFVDEVERSRKPKEKKEEEIEYASPETIAKAMASFRRMTS